MAFKKINDAITEIVGTMLIIGISISIFSIVYVSVLSTESMPLTPSVNLIGTIENNSIIIQHKGGKSVDINASLVIKVGEENATTVPIMDYLSSLEKDNGKWNFGETIIYTAVNLTGQKIDIGLLDADSNSLLFYTTLQDSLL